MQDKTAKRIEQGFMLVHEITVFTAKFIGASLAGYLATAVFLLHYLPPETAVSDILAMLRDVGPMMGLTIGMVAMSLFTVLAPRIADPRSALYDQGSEAAQEHHP